MGDCHDTTIISLVCCALFAALCLLGAFSAVPARAQVIWSMPGSTCAWDEDGSGEKSGLKVGLASVQHKSGKGTIALNCPIMNYGSAEGVEEEPWVLGLTYQDSTGPENNKASVKAQLYRMALVAGGETDVKPSRLGDGPGVPELVATADSDESGVDRRPTGEAPSIRTALKFFNHTFDFENFTYWVHVELTRSAGNQTVVFHTVFLAENVQ